MAKTGKVRLQTGPDRHGRFGPYGGRFVPETLMSALYNLDASFRNAWQDRKFKSEYRDLLADFGGRPTPLYYAERLSQYLQRGRIFLKREDLLHTGAHKLNNAIGQVLLAQRMGKARIIAETGAGQHGVATATVAARFGMSCHVFMGAVDMDRQATNVERMRLLGAEVIPVTSGTQTLKDATNEAIRDWIAHVDSTFYVIGSVVGPHPYPYMVRQFQRIIGDETRRQFRARLRTLPDVILACVGGGSNAIGMFHAFLKDYTELIGIEAGGCGTNSNRHAATLSRGSAGVLHGAKSYLLQTKDGQVIEPHSISAGLDYPGVGPEHSYLKDTGRVQYASVTDSDAVEACKLLTRLEGILPALEPSHAIAYLSHLPKDTKLRRSICVCLSGRGDKDMASVMNYRASKRGKR